VLTFENGTDHDYTVLGAWDADPDKNVLSYLSEMGQALLGKGVGETAEIHDPETEKLITVTIKAIDAL